MFLDPCTSEILCSSSNSESATNQIIDGSDMIICMSSSFD